MINQAYKLNVMEESKKWILTSPSKNEKGIDDQISNYVMCMKNFLLNEQRSNSIESLNFQQLVRESIEKVKQHSQIINLEITATIKQSVSFYSDKYSVLLILEHIIENAIIYQEKTKSENFVDITVEVTKKEVLIEVVDNGEGIHKINHDSIFKVFQSFSTQSKGYGIGLYLVKESLEHLGGTVKIASSKNIGTHCMITIPNSFSVE